MPASKGIDSRLEDFLAQKDIHLYSKERYVKKTSRKNPLVTVDYSDFLDKNHRIKSNLFPLVKNAIHQHALKIYFVMVSWWGRGEQARWTGSDLLTTLKKFQEYGFCEVYLSYQEGQAPPSGLCRLCRSQNIPVFYVDKYQLAACDSQDIIVPKASVGKAENVMKCVKLIQQMAESQGQPLDKILVIFVDDDYTQYHWLNYFLLFVPWVLSFSKETGDKKLDQLIEKIKKVGFIKSGSPRVILPYELQEQLVRGDIKPMDYLEVNLAVIDLALTHHRFGLAKDREKINELISYLREIKKNKQIFAPKNRSCFLDPALNETLEKIWREYIYRGGRVTQRLESIFRYLSHKDHYRWLREFTYLLHGDQGAPLDTWLEFSIFGGYALEISILLEAVWDRAFEDRQVLNIVSLPHSHQRSKDLAIWNMLDSIHFSFDLLRVLYGDLSVKNFLSVYKYQHNYPMLNRFGDVIRYQPQYKGIKIYPPLKTLALEE